MPSPPPLFPPPQQCDDFCSAQFGSSGLCRDGGFGSEATSCLYGTDCINCGRRDFHPPPFAPPAPPPTRDDTGTFLKIILPPAALVLLGALLACACHFRATSERAELDAKTAHIEKKEAKTAASRAEQAKDKAEQRANLLTEKLQKELELTAVTSQKQRVKVEDVIKRAVSVMRENGDLEAGLREVGSSSSAPAGSPTWTPRFSGSVHDLVMGDRRQTALGIYTILGIDQREMHTLMTNGIGAIEDEVKTNGTDEDRECLQYVLHERAGSNPKLFPNSDWPRDHGRNGETFHDFVEHESAKKANLTPGHVLALRLYTSAVFHSINGPLREQNMQAPTRHPLAATVVLLYDGLKRLRAIDSEKAKVSKDLWRGMKGVRPTDDFSENGGTEKAVLSATSDLKVAIKYACDVRSGTSLLLKITTSSFMNSGSDISFLSCFPDESEVCFPPLTYLETTSRRAETCHAEGLTFTVVEVSAHYGT